MQLLTGRNNPNLFTGNQMENQLYDTPEKLRLQNDILLCKAIHVH